MCVRLRQGDYATVHRVAEDPLETARRFAACGAQWLHMVDLDGAKEAKPVNRSIFVRVAKESGMRVEVGGGIRSMQTVEDYLTNGVARVILGSAALSQPDFVKEAVRRYGEQIAVGIDARGGMVAAEGWLQTSGVRYTELAKAMEQAGVSCLIFTDIAKDGMLQGPNFEQLAALSQTVSCNIIASGGVSTMEDVSRLAAQGLYGAICGKAVYTGAINLKEAVRIAAQA